MLIIWGRRPPGPRRGPGGRLSALQTAEILLDNTGPLGPALVQPIMGGEGGDWRDKTPQHFARGGQPPQLLKESPPNLFKIHSITKYRSIPNHYCCVL